MSQRTVLPVFIFAFILSLSFQTFSQDNTPPDVTIARAAIEKAPTSAEVMRERISKSKALLAVRNFAAAIYELENIKRENTEPAVNRVVNVLLMHAYLELSDYPKAKSLLKESQDSKGSEASFDYLAVAGQVVNSARSQSERYRSLGLNINDRNLPTVAIADIQGMRETLEMVIEHSKTMTADKDLQSNASALLEESSSARGALARDAYDAKQWKDKLADAREQMVASRSVILSATNPPPVDDREADVASSKIENDDLAVIEEDERPAEQPPAAIPAADTVAEKKPERKTIPIPLERAAEEEVKRPVANTVAKKPEEVKKDPETAKIDKDLDPNDRPVRVIGSAKRDEDRQADPEDQPNVKSALTADDVTEKDSSVEEPSGPLPIGSLIGYATRRVSPIYPRQARTMRLTGVVTVNIIVDEDGSVAEVNDADGPPMLTRAAEDAVRKWKFRPFTRDGQPVKATGFISFNFNL
ncbi:MAG: energy transducer TonB [Aridibacter famidurans]|nr:energy transducer TonB [Aridibacter famidurans]